MRSPAARSLSTLYPVMDFWSQFVFFCLIMYALLNPPAYCPDAALRRSGLFLALGTVVCPLSSSMSDEHKKGTVCCCFCAVQKYFQPKLWRSVCSNLPSSLKKHTTGLIPPLLWLMALLCLLSFVGLAVGWDVVGWPNLTVTEDFHGMWIPHYNRAVESQHFVFLYPQDTTEIYCTK